MFGPGTPCAAQLWCHSAIAFHPTFPDPGSKTIKQLLNEHLKTMLSYMLSNHNIVVMKDDRIAHETFKMLTTLQASSKEILIHTVACTTTRQHNFLK